MVPSDTGSSWGTGDSQAIALGGDCDTWEWSLWEEWGKPPGFEYGGIPVGSGVTVNDEDPPMWKFDITDSDGGGMSGNSLTASEPSRLLLKDEDGEFLRNLTLTRVEDGAVYPRTIAYVKTLAWPQGSGANRRGLFKFYHSASSDEEEEGDDWQSDFEQFFFVGSHLAISSAGQQPACDSLCCPSLDRYTGFSKDDYSNYPSAYCFEASSAIDTDPHLVMHSGWLGIVVDADMAGRNMVPFMGRVPRHVNASASSAEVAAALPAAHLNCSLVTADGTSYHLDKGLDQLTVAPVRHGHTVSHIIVTNVVWVDDADDSNILNTANMDAPVWWVEITLWAQSITVQIGWEEAAGSDDCAVCEDAVVTLEMEVEGRTHSRSKAFVAGSTAIDAVAFRFDDPTPEASSAGSSGASSPTFPVQVFSTNGHRVIYRNQTADVILEVPSDTPTCAYGDKCNFLPTVDITVANPRDSEAVLHLIVSRNFPGRHGFSTAG